LGFGGLRWLNGQIFFFSGVRYCGTGNTAPTLALVRDFRACPGRLKGGRSHDWLPHKPDSLPRSLPQALTLLIFFELLDERQNIEAADFTLREKAVHGFGFVVEHFENGIDFCEEQQFKISAIQLR
jgi:hypothetical protein